MTQADGVFLAIQATKETLSQWHRAYTPHFSNPLMEKTGNALILSFRFVTVPDPNLQMAVQTCKSVDTMQIKTLSLHLSSFVPFLEAISNSGGRK